MSRAGLRFADFKPLALADRKVIQPRLEASRPGVSELTFASLFMWRGFFDTPWAIVDDQLWVLERQEDGSRYFLQPVGDGRCAAATTRRMLDWLRAELQEPAPAVERVNRSFRDALGPGFAAEPLRDHFDYVYRRQDLTDLRGRAYHAKRNHLHRLRREHTFTRESLRPGHAAACCRVLENWAAAHDDEDARLEAEAVRDVLRHLEPLHISGCVIRIDEQVVAFAITEQVGSETLFVHVEKAITQPAGLFALINQQTASGCDPGIHRINRGQDLGIAGLRRAKQSYRPATLIEKFRVTRPS